jgi:hypothetical protein
VVRANNARNTLATTSIHATGDICLLSFGISINLVSPEIDLIFAVM